MILSAFDVECHKENEGLPPRPQKQIPPPKQKGQQKLCQDAQSAQRDVSLWKDKYETSQLQVRDRHICLDLDIFCLEQHMFEYRGIL